MKLFGNIFGDQQLVNLDQQIEDIISSIPVRDFGDDTSDTDASNLIHQLLAVDDKFGNKEQQKKNIFYKDFTDRTGIMNEVGTLLDKLRVEPERSARYRTYEEIYQSIPMIKKMLGVWLSNLVQKNPVSGKSLLIKDLSENNPDMELQDDDFDNKKMAAQIFVDELLEYFDLVNKLKYRILPVQQLYGDCFVEVINLRDFSLSPSKNQNDLNNVIDTNVFLGESSVNLTAAENQKNKNETRKNSVSIEQKLKRLEEKIQPNTVLNMDNICSDIAELFVDTSWDEDDIFLGESYAESLRNPSGSIVIEEKESFKNVDTIDCFYEYVYNNAGELKPHLRFRDSAVDKKNNSQQQPQKKRGRPPKNKTLSEQESQFTPQDRQNFKAKLEKLGIHTNIDMSNCIMLIHKPQNIVILQTTYGSKLGYVEVADRDNLEQYNLTAQLSTIIGRVVSVANNTANSQEDILARIVKMIVRKIVQQAAQKRHTGANATDDVDKILKSISPEVLNAIKKLIIETDKDNPKKQNFRRLKARFIPIERCFHFTVPSVDYFPYGLSFIDPLVLQGKLYILSQLSNVIMKLSRAAPIRKWLCP